MSLSKAIRILDLLSQPPYEYKIGAGSRRHPRRGAGGDVGRPLLLVAALLAAVALVANLLPAGRAARVDPMSALREE